ncbi:hypothetical protein DPMN_089015 [Dreissena polymorpha]|uniref:Uncharacterized protein n=1 Tax=Dreissena polymorpha TaxID=45954 RepID=A0A9D4KV55_DREPO|nr:hypothetical protein DPMN_089015 [Dreissena polymorpha]
MFSGAGREQCRQGCQPLGLRPHWGHHSPVHPGTTGPGYQSLPVECFLGPA